MRILKSHDPCLEKWVIMIS